jgi:hypothetical protein
MLVYDPDQRITANKLLKLAFFKPLREEEEMKYNREVNPRITQVPKNVGNVS